MSISANADGDRLSPNRDNVETNGERGALERLLVTLVQGRHRFGKGLFGGILLIAYVDVICQILGFSYLNTSIALGIVQATPIPSLLFIIPGVALVPALGFVVASTITCYVLSKFGKDQQIRGRGRAVYVLFVLIFFSAPALMMALPLYVAVGYGVAMLAFFLSIKANKSQPHRRKSAQWANWFFSLRIIRSLRSYLARLSGPSLAITNLWSARIDDDGETPSNDPSEKLVETIKSGDRARVAALAGVFGVLLAISVLWPRPWMPLETIQLNSNSKPSVLSTVTGYP